MFRVSLVYLGYLSGLGGLRDPMFSGSRFAVGSSYDEIIDKQTGRHYRPTPILIRRASIRGRIMP